MVNMAIGEMLTNMVGAYVGDINCLDVVEIDVGKR